MFKGRLPYSKKIKRSFLILYFILLIKALFEKEIRKSTG